MGNKIKIWTICLLIISGKNTYGQNIADTTALVNEFNRVMSFAVQPYIYFTILTKMNAVPILQQQDTISLKGVYYKNETDFYYYNGQEEVYIQDSFMIQINQNRKSIWISKVDIASKEKMNVLPVNNKQMQELFRKKYTIQKIKINGKTDRLNFVTRQKADSSTTVTTTIGLEYSVNNYLPGLMEIEMHMQQPLSNELLDALKTDNIDDTKLIQTIGDVKYLVRTQKISVSFIDINNTKEKAMSIPSWKEVLDFHAIENEFIAKGLYKDYEITKTF